MSKMLGYMLVGSVATIFIQYMCYNHDTCDSAFKKMKDENDKAMSWLKHKFR